MKSFSVSVPEPCHEDWNLMQPNFKGRFCNSCKKSVIDFTDKTDLEIQSIFLAYKDQQICGHFKKTQVNKSVEIHLCLNDLPLGLPVSKVFTIALFIVFGTLLFSCTTNKDEKIEQIEWIAEESPNVTGVTYISMDTPDPGYETDTFTPSFRNVEYVKGEIVLSEEVKEDQKQTLNLGN